MPAESVHCVITSPPYWGLRNYRGGPGMIGLEPTLAEHLAALVEVFREVRRVLRPDGIAWLNYGDAYAPDSGCGASPDGARKGRADTREAHKVALRARGSGLKRKDLMLLPARVAMALQESGWWVRSEVVWEKPNPMPESATGRPAAAHEKVFLLARSGAPVFWVHEDGRAARSKPAAEYCWRNRETGARVTVEPDGWRDLWRTRDDGERERLWARVNLWRGRDYFYAAEAVRTQRAPATVGQLDREYHRSATKDAAAGAQDASGVKRGIVRRLRDKQRGHSRRHAGFNARWDSMTRAQQMAMGANLRNVWRISPRPLSIEHFATFPPELVERCLLAGTSGHGVCAECGAPWIWLVGAGWRPTCECAWQDPRPAVVLDPFGGAGTVGLVARRMGREAILVEVSEHYAAISADRMRAEAPLFAAGVSVTPAAVDGGEETGAAAGAGAAADGRAEGGSVGKARSG